MKHPALFLAVLVAVALAAVLSGHHFLQESIEQQRAHAAQQLRAGLLASIAHDSVDAARAIEKSIAPHTRIHDIAAVRQNGQPRAWLVQLTATDGYNGDIKMLALFAADAWDKRPGIRVIRHAETPGLGDFIGDERVATVFDGVSGATITANAVAQSLARTREWLDGCLRERRAVFICQ